MRVLVALLASAMLVISLSPVAEAALGGKGDSDQSSTSQPNTDLKGSTSASKSESEMYYGYAYEEIAKAEKDLGKGNEKKALKRFEKAMQWSERSVEFDPKYHEAWNLVGYTARKLGKYDRSLEAYRTCLEIKPEYAPAREYLGEAYVELGKLEEAKEQLAWLKRLNATEEAGKLEAKIAAKEKGEAAPATASGQSGK
jgi:tetratricopeptide (TPR) repeat protein